MREYSERYSERYTVKDVASQKIKHNASILIKIKFIKEFFQVPTVIMIMIVNMIINSLIRYLLI